MNYELFQYQCKNHTLICTIKTEGNFNFVTDNTNK